MSHFDIGAWAKKKRKLKEKAIDDNRIISQLKQDISDKESTINELKRKARIS